jgi:hypothetical protein
VASGFDAAARHERGRSLIAFVFTVTGSRVAGTAIREIATLSAFVFLSMRDLLHLPPATQSPIDARNAACLISRFLSFAMDSSP